MASKSEINERISEVLNHHRISETSFAKQIGMVQKTVNLQIKGTSTLSASLVSSVASQFPDISMEWLIRGNGQMLLSSTAGQSKVTNKPIGQPIPTESDALASAMALIQQQNEFIQAQSILINQLKAQLSQQSPQPPTTP